MPVFQLGPAACRSYLLACDRTRQALLLDPLVDDVEDVAARLERDGWDLAYVVDTHTHADHVSGGRALADRLGTPYGLHGSSESTLPTERLADGQVLEVGDLRAVVIHTPGHTPDSITIEAGGDLFTGDFLFLAQDGAGRLDLPGGDPGVHWESLGRLAALPDDHRVLPGHDYAGLAHGTLGGERRRNPRFQQVSREEYVAWQRAVAMETPEWMLDVIAANLGQAASHQAHHGAPPAPVLPDPAGASDCAGPGGGGVVVGGGGGACSAGPMARVPLVMPEEAHRRRGGAAPPFLLDVREPFEFAMRHAPGAVLVPLGELPGNLGLLPDDPDAEILVICRSGGRSARAAEYLIETGRRRVFNVAGGTDGWAHLGLPVER